MSLIITAPRQMLSPSPYWRKTMPKVEVEIVELVDNEYILELSNRADCIGPLTKQELLALLAALIEWRREES
tara:strand:+ start:71 stop:286 length:216 start_codon:yes stop_codon:yes gene_type:complete